VGKDGDEHRGTVRGDRSGAVGRRRAKETLVDPAPTDAEIAAILVAVQHGDDRDSLLDNSALAEVCDLSLEIVAERLAIAKQRKLIWGSRSNHHPAPWYTELELTVQGRRFLATQRAIS
jgi:hypothetical protein